MKKIDRCRRFVHRYHNLHRRHMNESLRGMVGPSWRTCKRGGAGEYKTDKAIAPSPSVSQKQAAEMLNIGVDSIKRSKRVLKGGIPELVSMMEGGEVTASAPSQVSKLPKDEHGRPSPAWIMAAETR